METAMIQLWRNLYRRAAHRVLSTSDIRHLEPSLICCADDVTPSSYLFQLALDAVARAWKEPIDVRTPSLKDSVYYNVFPGEHYRLLRALAHELDPSSAVEIGTFTGMGTYAISQGLRRGAIHTYDVQRWDSFASHLQPQDFEQGKVRQVLADLSSAGTFRENFDTLNAAKLIFMDAPKDGVFEYAMLPLLQDLDPLAGRVLVLDDIRFVNMIDLWRSIKSPKLDMTSFGHWSGTGVVDLSDGLRLARL
jgi:predicted O-methyltransferase YrrM